MKFYQNLILIVSLCLFSCGVQKAEQEIRNNKELTFNTDLAKSALNFSKHVLKENLRVIDHQRVPSSYLDIQMIFEADDYKSDHFESYTSYSNLMNPDNSAKSDYDGFILFVANYKDVKSAEHAFQQLKSNTKIRITELEGFAGLLVEQVQVFERIRKSGGLFTQKDKYVFYLLKTCEAPPIGSSWSDYENLFLEYIMEKNEEIEVLKADCAKDIFSVQKIKAIR